MIELIRYGVATHHAARTVGELTHEEVVDRLQRVTQSGPEPAPHDEAVIAICAAAAGLDAAGLRSVYRRLLRRADLTTVWESAIVPALERIGELWSRGDLGVEHEHLASEVLSDELRALIRTHRQSSTTTVVLASASEEQHHLPLLALEAELTRRGVGTVLLGARVPQDAVVSAVRSCRAGAVFLWATMLREADEPLWADLAATGRSVTAVTGGPGWPDPPSTHTYDDLHIVHVPDLSTAVRMLSRAS